MSGDRLQAVLALLAAGLVAGWPAAASPLAPVERPEDELLVLELRLDGQVLSREMTGYLRDVQDGGGVLLPLGQLARALDFPIAVEPAAGTAGGWFVRENRRFSLDLERGEVVVAGAAGALDPGKVEVHADDLYVDSSLVGEWFPVRAKVDLSRLAVLLEAREKLPLQLRLERRLAWERQERKAGPRKAGGPLVETPYRALDWPTLDGTITAGTAGHGAGPEGRKVDVFRHEALLSGDLLAMSAELYVQGESGGGERTGASAPGRLKLGRKDPGGSLLGPLRATEIEIGSLFTPQRPLLAPGRPVRGALLSNHPVDQVEELERATLHGDALPGWEAELYQNESLIDYQVVGDDGRWVFVDVPLLLGINRFRIVLHGPQGQRREEVRRLLVGDERVRAGESRYRLALGEPEEETAGTDGRRLFSLDLRRGLARGLSAGVSLDSLGVGRERHTYLGLGLRKETGGTLGRLDLVADSAGGAPGWAGRAALQGRWRSFGVFAQLDRYRGFASAQVPAGLDPPVSRLLLRLDGSAGRGRSLPASWSVAVEGGERESGAAGLRLATRITGTARGLVLGHRGSLAVARQEGGAMETSEAGGAFLLSGRGRWGAVRGELGYELEPGARVRDASLSMDRGLGRGRSLRLGVQRRIAPAATTRTSAGIAWDFRQVLLGLGLHYEHGAGSGLPGFGSGKGGLSADLSLAYSLRRDPLSGRWRVRSVRSATEGAAAARVFLDEDRDGRFGPGDAPLPGVRFTSDGGGALPGETDEQGILLLSGLPLYRPVEVGVALGSLEDPAWVPQREGFGLELRPGATPGVEIPVVVSGEVEGTVFLKTGERLVPVASVEMQLVDDRGVVRRETRSEHDGFYLFERVPPGRYAVRVAPGQVRRLGLRPVPERAVEIGPDGEVVRGIDLQVERVVVAEGR